MKTPSKIIQFFKGYQTPLVNGLQVGLYIINMDLFKVIFLLLRFLLNKKFLKKMLN